MTTLKDIPFDELKAGMKFRHPVHGEQIILETGLSKWGRQIRFHASDIYDGHMPRISTEVESDIYEALAGKTYPRGASDLEYQGMAGEHEIAEHHWQWLQVRCPHCHHRIRILAVEPSYGRRRCIGCGIEFDARSQPVAEAEE